MINFRNGKTNLVGTASSRSMLTGTSFSTTGTDLGTEFDSGMLEGLLDVNNPVQLYDMYREIYAMDTVSGPTVDLMSTLPWSDCILQGVNDSSMLKIYYDTMEELDVVPTMTNLATTYLVLGNVIGSLLFDAGRGIFTDIIIQDPNYAEITPIPLIGYDPKIDIRIADDFKRFLSSQDKRDIEARKEISPALMQRLQSGKIELDPLSTLYLQRITLPGMQPISYYTRILPIWLIEKALMRGTIIGAWRRQRSILWIKAGEGDWEPSDEQLAQFSQLFQNADRDPQGAVVVTRNGVDVQEVRQGNDFWKISDEWDIFANAKMRALGVNESFLSGETNYSTAEVALSVFMEHLRAFRDNLTRAVWNDKIFLLLAKYHGFRKRTQAELNNRVRLTDSERNRDPYGLKKALYATRNLAEAAQYEIPTVHWTKELHASGDSNVADMLEKAKEFNIPIPLSMFATACGVNLNSIIEGFEEDVKQREVVKKQLDYVKSNGLDFSGDGGGMYGQVMQGSDVVMNGGDSLKFDKIVTTLAKNLPSDIVLDKEKTQKLMDYAMRLSKNEKGDIYG